MQTDQTVKDPICMELDYILTVKKSMHKSNGVAREAFVCSNSAAVFAINKKKNLLMDATLVLHCTKSQMAFNSMYLLLTVRIA
jgi:hypothetical protein